MFIAKHRYLPRSARRIVAAGCLLASIGAHATCVVNSTLDDPAEASAKVTSTNQAGWSGTQKAVATLRDCIVEANLMTGPKGVPTSVPLTVELSKIAASTVTLADNLPLLFNNTIITTTTGKPVRIDGGGTHRIFFVSGLPSLVDLTVASRDGAQPVSVTLSNLVLQNGLAQGGDGAGGGMGAGGALFVNKGAGVTLANVTFLQNMATGGSALNLDNNGVLGGAGMGPGANLSRGGGGLSGPALYTSGAGIGTAGTSVYAGGFGGTGLGQISVVQNFATASFNVDTGAGTTGSLIGGGGWATATANKGRPGGFGGGGGFDPTSNYPVTSGGDGGFGGGGAWVQVVGQTGGSGGFGGSGGGGLFFATGGNGGFGAGAGTVGDFATAPGVSGVGASIPVVFGGGYTGGDGAGFGGAVFVRSGGKLLIQSTTATSVANGVALGGGNGAGAAAGDGFFLMSGTQTTLDIALRYTVHDQIADDSLVSLPSGQSYVPGNGSGANLVKIGSGTLIIDGTDSRAGTTDIQNGTLAGAGLIQGATTLESAAMILPGDPSVNGGIGTLTLGTLTWSAGGAMAYQLGANDASSDHLTVLGSLQKQGTGPFLFYFGAGATPPVAGQTYRLITAANTSAFSAQDFSFVNDASLQSLAGNFSVTATAVYFTVTAVQP